MDSFAQELKDFVEALESGSPMPVTGKTVFNLCMSLLQQRNLLRKTDRLK